MISIDTRDFRRAECGVARIGGSWCRIHLRTFKLRAQCIAPKCLRNIRRFDCTSCHKKFWRCTAQRIFDQIHINILRSKCQTSLIRQLNFLAINSNVHPLWRIWNFFTRGDRHHFQFPCKSNHKKIALWFGCGCDHSACNVAGDSQMQSQRNCSATKCQRIRHANRRCIHHYFLRDQIAFEREDCNQFVALRPSSVNSRIAQNLDIIMQFKTIKALCWRRRGGGLRILSSLSRHRNRCHQNSIWCKLLWYRTRSCATLPRAINHDRTKRMINGQSFDRLSIGAKK